MWLIDIATSEWIKTNTAKHSKEVWKNYSIKKTKLLLQLEREEIQRIVAFMTGHGRFKAHLSSMNILTESKCNFCEKDETAKYIMCECDGFAAL